MDYIQVSLREIKDIITNDLRNKLDENVETINKVIDFITEGKGNIAIDKLPDDDDNILYFEYDDGTVYDLWDTNRFGMPNTEEIEGILYRLCEVVEDMSFDDVVNINVSYNGNILVLWETPSYQFLIDTLKG